MYKPLYRRFSPFAILVTGTIFIAAGPLFWFCVERPLNATTPPSAKNLLLAQQVLPSFHYGFSRLKQGDFPLWNERQLCGTPYFANVRYGVFQPLHWIFIFIAMPYALAVHAFLALTLSGFFFTLFMRSLGIHGFPSLLAGLAYMGCGTSALSMSYPPHANVMVWLPLTVLLFREYGYRPRRSLLVLGSLAVTGLLLSGSPLLACLGLLLASVYGLGACIAYSSPLTDSPPRSRSQTFQGLVAMVLCGTLLAGIQWVPTLAWLWTLDKPLDFLWSYGVSSEIPKGIRGIAAQILLGYSERLPAPFYFGIIPLLLVPSAFLHPLPRWERALLTLVIGIPIVLALLGPRTYLAEDIARGLLHPMGFAVCVIVGLGADRLFMVRPTLKTPRLWGPVLLSLALSLLIVIVVPEAIRGRIVPFFVALILFSIFPTRWSRGIAVAVLAGFLFVDICTSYVNRFMHPVFLRENELETSSHQSALLREAALEGRVMVGGPFNLTGIHPNSGMTIGLRIAGGLGFPLTPEQRVWNSALNGGMSTSGFLTDFSIDNPAYARLLHAMSVRVIVVPRGKQAKIKGFALPLQRRSEYKDMTVYVNDNAVPRLYWASIGHIALDTLSAIEALCAPGFDGRSTCVITPSDAALEQLASVIPPEQPKEPWIKPPSEAPNATFIITTDEPEHLSIQVTTAAPGILVLGDTWDPGWKSYVNGVKTPILRANGLFRGIVLPPGNHQVEFRYRPVSLYFGIVSGLCGLMLLLGILCLPQRRQDTALSYFQIVAPVGVHCLIASLR